MKQNYQTMTTYMLYIEQRWKIKIKTEIQQKKWNLNFLFISAGKYEEKKHNKIKKK